MKSSKRAVLVAMLAALAAQPALADKKLRFTFVHPSNTTNIFFQAVQRGMKDACEKVQADCQMLYVQNEMDIQQELTNLDTAVAQHVDGIMVTIVNDTAYNDAIKRAIDAHIPVIAVNTDDSRGAAGSPRLSFIGQNYQAAGYALGKSVTPLFPKGPIHVLLGASAPGQNWTEARLGGVVHALQDFKAAHPDQKVTWARIDTGMDLAGTGSRVAAYVTQHPETTAYFDAGFWEAGAAVAVADAGYKPGQLLMGGFDTVPAALEQMKKGYIQRIVDQQPYLQGFLPVIQLYLIDKYKLSPWDVDTGRTVIKPADVDALMALSKAGIR